MAPLDEYLYSDYVSGISEKDTKNYMKLLHKYIGTVNMLKPFPEMKRIPESIPLNLHELMMQYLYWMLSQNDGFSLTEEEESLLMH
ncbi:MAG: hypothetical protein K2H91_02380 [Lachnospiraceae bacterium]|nr:hypothetical protein [Lachnospiraceae bacterium]